MTAKERVAEKIAAARALWGTALDLDTLEVAAVLTLGLLLLHAGSVWYLTVPMTVLCIAGFAVRSLLLNPTYWLVIASVTAFANFRNWYTVDNHKFLTTYWCIALHCSLLARDPRRAASLQGRLLVGLCFLFADIWKVLSPDFLNGTFFKYQLLADGRFSWLAKVVAGVPSTAQHVNSLRFAELMAWDSGVMSAPVLGGSRLTLVAQVMTWWTIVIEVLLAAAFLAPWRFLSRWRHPLLICFALTTYAIANVVGFGWLLIAMGIAHCPQEARFTRGMYFACFVFLHLFLIPFRNFGF